LAAVHTEPMTSGGTHFPLMQRLPAVQFAVVAQVVGQAAPAHRYAPQFVVPPATHVPMPSHVDALVSVLPLHDAATQVSPLANCWHAPTPHAPVVPHVDCAVAAHSLSGSVPSVTTAQVPLAPPVFAATHA
jgi:hypothetical protein